MNSEHVRLAQLRAERSEIESRLKIMETDIDRLRETPIQGGTQVVTYKKIAREVIDLKHRLEMLIGENRDLVSTAKMTRTEVTPLIT